jgi:hypothetical protein
MGVAETDLPFEAVLIFFSLTYCIQCAKVSGFRVWCSEPNSNMELGGGD